MSDLFVAICNAAFGEIIGRHLDQDLVTSQHTDAILPHAASGVRDDFMIIFELYAERGVRQQFSHNAWKFQDFFLGHTIGSIPFSVVAGLRAHQTSSGLSIWNAHGG